MTTNTQDEKISAFIEKWKNGSQPENQKAAGGKETANLQMFIIELCQLLDLPSPDKALADNRLNTYAFERGIKEQSSEGKTTHREIDLYKRGCFVLEGKDTGKKGDTDSWNADITKALRQAENYARNVPAEEGRPPFIIVVDVGKYFVLYSEFSRSGSNYVAFPDSRSHKISLDKLRDTDTRELLRTIWLEPLKLDPVRYAGKVTRAVADKLALLAKSLEADKKTPEQVAGFLMRCLFTMFAEDVGLLPERSFTELLERSKASPDTFHYQLESLWQTMNSGGFSAALNAKIIQFNGGLYADASAIALRAEQIELLIGAARSDWRHVEPSIFGTLLERALNTKERHKLGAHYTPRAYVERLVLPTLIEPLRSEWADVQAAVEAFRKQRKTKDAIAELQGFLVKLCNIRVLDPACGSGNFLYVALEHMKRLEGDVLEVLNSIKKTGSFDMEGLTVDPHQFLGIEINPRAAKVAEMVLWIGYLQWHFRTYGNVNPPEPVLRDFHNIENRDALIAYDAVETVTDDNGNPVTRWDGITTKPSPVTGEPIPDESAQVEQYRYINPRKAEWPQADYIVGNPPFIGKLNIRVALGDGYVDAVRNTWKEVPDSADFVMYWWHIAAETVRNGSAKQFGFITTNSIKQTFNRRVIESQLASKPPLSLIFAIPDHPWVDSTDGAAVRIAMTAGSTEQSEGRLLVVREETLSKSLQDEIDVKLEEQRGVVFSDLRMGADVASTHVLLANKNLSSTGVIPHGAGMTITQEQADSLGLKSNPDLSCRLRPYLNGKDLTQSSRNMRVIDMYGLNAEQVKQQYPSIYQWLLDRVKPERDQNKDKDLREKWWLHRRNNEDLRNSTASLEKYIVTVMTSKHRLFSFISGDTLADQGLVVIASENSAQLGYLSSRIHIVWSLATGGRLGVGNDPRYNKTRCFETFPFPDANPEQQEKIRNLAERLDTHRKQQQAQHPDLTLTGIYNVLEKLRAGETLTAKEKTIHEQGLVSILRELHDELDRAVFAAYGWSDLAEKLVGLPGATTPLPDKSDAQMEAEEELLRRLVALNAERAAEEAQGHIRWLRPDYQNPNWQNPNASPVTTQQQAELDVEDTAASQNSTGKTAAKQDWPKTMREQITATRNLLSGNAMLATDIASHFKNSKKCLPLIQDALAALVDLGMASEENGSYRLAR